MAELRNCPSCGSLYVKNSVRDVCEKCYKEEEKKFDIVYKFLKKRENRSATKDTVVEETGVDEELIFKWVRKGRLQLAQFPNLGYPCAKCGTIIREGKLCTNCIGSIRNDLEVHEKEEIRKEQIRLRTYHSQ
ncbi:TIGR03826 family flagellar region protein [Heyndrickxia sporothermodurans]